MTSFFMNTNLYKKSDKQFIHEISLNSYKKNAFYLKSANFDVQVTAGILIIVELYLSIMTTVHSNLVSPIYSTFVALYALAQLYTYFGFRTHKVYDACFSYLAQLLLAAVSGMMLLKIINSQNLSNEISLTLLSLVKIIDALYGFNILVS